MYQNGWKHYLAELVSRHARKMFPDVIFPRFGTPRMVISDGGSHFMDKTFRAFLKELGAKHNIATP